jgi:hypothetical protein
VAEDFRLHFFETDAERVAMKEFKWWTIEELEQSSVTVFPPDLAKVLQSSISRPARIY